MLFWQILIDGFAICALYALGATGFTLIFGVSGVLNLSHGAIMVAAAVAAWAASGNLEAGTYLAAAFGVVVALMLALFTYYLVVRRLQLSRAVREEEKEIFILTGTLALGHHDPGGDRVSLHQQRQDRAADRRRRGRRSSACARRRTRSSPRSSAGRRLAALAVRQPHAGRQGGARRVDESARRHAARN